MNNKKKCKYCMSEMNINAVVCPKCRKRQDKSKLALTLSLSIGLPVLFLLIIIPTIIGVINDSEKSKFQRKAELFISTAQLQYTQEFMENNGKIKDDQCYYIDEDEYSGSVEINSNQTNKIWLSNGKYYASGESGDISVVKSSKNATKNCNKY